MPAIPNTLTVQTFLDQLQAERDATWPEEQLVAHAALRQSLEDKGDRAGFVQVGDRAESFTLAEADGGEIVLAELLES